MCLSLKIGTQLALQYTLVNKSSQFQFLCSHSLFSVHGIYGLNNHYKSKVQQHPMSCLPRLQLVFHDKLPMNLNFSSFDLLYRYSMHHCSNEGTHHSMEFQFNRFCFDLHNDKFL